MGTTFIPGYSKADIKKEVLGNVSEVIAHRTVGNHFWVAANHPKYGSYIILFLLSKSQGDWGYKPISEDMGPFYYTCPLSLLDKTDGLESVGGWAGKMSREWREKVREYHRAKKQVFEPGQKVVHLNGTEFTVVGPYKGRQWLVRSEDGELFRSKAEKLRPVGQ